MKPITLSVDATAQPEVLAAMRGFSAEFKALLEKYCPVLQEHMGALSPALVEEMKESPVHFHPVVSLITGAGLPTAIDHIYAQNSVAKLGLGKSLTLPMAFCDAISNTAQVRYAEYAGKTGGMIAKVLGAEAEAEAAEARVPEPVVGAAELAEPGTPNPASPWAGGASNAE